MKQPTDPRLSDPKLADRIADEPADTRPGGRRFADVVAARTDRRSLIGGGLATLTAGFLGWAPATAGDARHGQTASAAPDPTLGFGAVPVSTADTVTVPEGYRWQALLPWGEPITGDHPAFSPDNTAEEQAMQMGSHHDGMHFFPIEGRHPFKGSSNDGLLVMNHEYVEPRLMHRAMLGQPLGAFQVSFDANGRRDADQVRKEINAHGVSITRIRRDASGDWAPVRDGRNRRITGHTPMQFSGPLRGHASVRTPYSPDGLATRGTLNNCAHGVTPWNTYLTCEENWWFYFTLDDHASAPASLTRYSVGRFTPWQWHLADSDDDALLRFDASARGEAPADDWRNEPHCFGWVVEVDPFDPDSTPVKRTHLGRFSHEGAVFGPVEPGRPVVVYSGDDATDAYIYKFVSARTYEPDNADGSLLDEGTLYVARFDDDGSGRWLALRPGENGLTAEAGFPDLASVLLNARGAGDVVGATPMDRPEWGAVDPVSGQVYFSLTNNARRAEDAVNGPNPRPGNVYGHVVRWREHGDDPAAGRFDWDLFILAGDERDSRDPNGEPLDADNVFGSPDGLWADPDGRLWIQTDVAESSLYNGPYEHLGNNMMLAADPRSGEVRRFLTGPVGQEITGVVTTPDRTTMFINVQHPGAGVTTAEAFAAGRHSSHWPDGGDALPRSATVAITREDGGVIGAPAKRRED